MKKRRGALVLAALWAFSMFAGGSVRSAPFEQAGDHLLWLRLSDGAVLQSLDPVGGCCISIRDVETDGRGGWFVAGNFTSLGGVDCPELVHVSASLRVDPDWCPRVVGGSVYLLARAGHTLYLAGDFDTIGGIRHGSLAAVDTRTGSVTSWQPQASFDPEALAAGAGRVFLGKYASDVLPTKASMIAVDANTGRRVRWDGRFDNRGCGTRLCYVHFGGILVRGRSVYVGGTFSRVQGQAHIGLVALDARTARPLVWRAGVNREAVNTWLSGADTQHWHLAAVGNTVYVSGDPIYDDFASINGVRRSGVAALDARTGHVRSWNPRGDVADFDATPSAVVTAETVAAIARVDRATGRKVRWRDRRPPVLELSVVMSGSTVLVHYVDEPTPKRG